MINYEVLYRISYGMYIISAGNTKQANGYFSNTFFQITSEPPCFAASCHKDNYTAEFIRSSGFFSVSVLPVTASPELIGRFGYRSGRDFNKMDGLRIYYTENEVPVVLNDAVAWQICRLKNTIEIGTHLLFIGELIDSELIDSEAEVMTYQYYRMVKKGLSPKHAPTYIDKSKLIAKPQQKSMKKYKCTACGYLFDEEREGRKFLALPQDWVCPVCGAEKADFIAE